MPYACAYFTYGIDLTEKPRSGMPEALREALDGRYDVPELSGGFFAPYSGWADHDPLAFGVPCGGAEECDEEFEDFALDIGEPDYFSLEDFGIDAAGEAAVKAEYAELLCKYPQAVQDALTAYGDPKFFVLWGTS